MTIEEKMLLKEIRIVALKNIKELLGNGKGIEDLPFQSPPTPAPSAVAAPPKAPTTLTAPTEAAETKELPDDLDQISLEEALCLATAKSTADIKPLSEPASEPPSQLTATDSNGEPLPYPYRSARAWWRTEKRRRRYEDARIKKDAKNRCYGFEAIVKWCDSYERSANRKGSDD